MAFLLAVGQHFPLEVTVQLSAEERQDVLRREVDRGVIQQPRVQFAQRTAAGEQDVRGEFRLCGHPVVAHVTQPAVGTDVRIDLLRPLRELLDPVQLCEAVGQLLGLLGVVELCEGVVMLHEAEAFFEHLPGQPVVAVDVDLDRVGEPRFQADIHQAEFGVQVIIVQHALRPPLEVQRRTAFAVFQGNRAAGLLNAQHGDHSLGELILADECLNELVLLELSLAILVGATGPLCQRLGVPDQRLGMLFQKRQEVFAFDSQTIIDPGIQIRFSPERQISFENHSIKATQDRDNGNSKLFEKSRRELHGVLRMMAV